MNLLIDAQLPAQLATALELAGHDALHTAGLPDGNRTDDHGVIERADRDRRWVVTKDSDFVARHLLSSRPRNLLLISLGNCPNRELIPLVVAAIHLIERQHPTAVYVEVSRSGLIVHA